ncbi:extracellular solute-binding protein, family 3 [Oceanospirillum multiglobuliferum]|uniref:Uncharacterized protein n=1 Tax=Oceanospirillum multiglobuliferum TaxID=64969 RepID=A0A1T4M6K9_9GAMM|nr:transporter substrate-binding domain-containing protein [Oceanospirillum multiglobuliferum]OPX56227.1 hypothetical protein BTE48_04425 [Oceanospirillum multiglobuliferum]SJZ62623.1 extracellular solute-binding protein, family 3 [Oceanospirillum multiglobuliferum]
MHLLSQHHKASFGLLALLLFGTLLFSRMAEAAPIRFLVGYPDETHVPFYLDSGTNVPLNPGFAVEVMQQLGKKVSEVKFELVRCSFEQCLEQIRIGKLDGLFNVPYREKWLFTGKYPFTKARVDDRQRMNREEYALYRVKDTLVSTDGGQIYGLKGRPVIIPAKHPLADWLKEHEYPLIVANNTTDALQKLLQRQAPAAVLVVEYVEHLARQHPELVEMLRRSEESILTEDYYLMLSRQFYAKKPWLAEKIWAEQTKIVAEKYNDLSSKYFQ